MCSNLSGSWVLILRVRRTRDQVTHRLVFLLYGLDRDLPAQVSCGACGTARPHFEFCDWFPSCLHCWKGLSVWYQLTTLEGRKTQETGSLQDPLTSHPGAWRKSDWHHADPPYPSAIPSLGKFQIIAKIVVLPCWAVSTTRNSPSPHALILGKGR